MRYYEKEIREEAITARLCEENLLLMGPKATSKDALAEILAAVLNAAAEVSFLLHLGIAVICVFTDDDRDISAAHTIYGHNFTRIRHLEQFTDKVGTLIQNQIRGF